MRKVWLITGLLTLFLVGIGIGIGIGRVISYGSDDTLPAPFNVGGMMVGALPADAALRQLQLRVTKLESTLVTVRQNDNNSDGNLFRPSPLTFKQLGMRINIDEAIRAIEQYRDYTWWQRAKVRYRGKIVSSYPMKVTWDENVFKQTAHAAWSILIEEKPKLATRTINDQDVVTYTPEELGHQLDLYTLLKHVKKVAPASLIIAELKPIIVSLPIITTSPQVTLAKLMEEGIERKIVEFTTSFSTSGEGRSYNVTVAAKALNDTLLMPDEIFDYGQIVTKAEKVYGYKEAPVILKGKLTPGIGGGICQVSSTLYNAALLSGMDIVERRNHSLVVHYLPKGLDATFADGYVNFKFRNSTGKQLLIRTVVKDKNLTVKLFGTMPKNVTYRTETAEVKVIPPKIDYVANNKLLLGKQDLLQQGEPGYVIESYLIKLVNSEIIERRKLSNDTYRAQNTLIAVNPRDPRLNPDDNSSPSPSPSPSETDGPIEPL